MSPTSPSSLFPGMFCFISILLLNISSVSVCLLGKYNQYVTFACMIMCCYYKTNQPITDHKVHNSAFQIQFILRNEVFAKHLLALMHYGMLQGLDPEIEFVEITFICIKICIFH